MQPLTLPAQLNAIRVITAMAHESAVAGRNLEAVQLLNRAQGMIVHIVVTNNVGSDTNQSHRTQVEREPQPTKTSAPTATINYNTLFDEIAVAQLGRKYNRATKAQQEVIRTLAQRVMEGTEVAA